MLEAHAMASGMGGMRTAGDLVARMEMAKGMRINEAKDYVAKRLNVSIRELSDPIVMGAVRDELNLGLIQQMPDRPKGMEAKFRIAEFLGIEINSVNRFKAKSGL
jgi:dimethylamine--corrinoid protein Co-methyltransferase